MEKTEHNKTWDRACASCRYCKSLTPMGAADLIFVCKRFPPTVQAVITPTMPTKDNPTGVNVTTPSMWPGVSKTDWCGEYEKELH